MKVVFTREMTGWRFDRAKGDAVVFRPGPQAIKSLLLYGAMAGGLSIVIYAAGGRGQGLYPAVHGALWLIAISWPLSCCYQRVAFSRDDEAGVVRARGQGILFPFRRDFPLRQTDVQLVPSKHYEHFGTSRAATHVGYDWKVMVLGTSPMALQIGYSPVTTLPERPPSDVREAFKRLADLFGVPADIQISEAE